MTISEDDDVLGTIYVLQTLFKRLSHAEQTIAMALSMRAIQPMSGTGPIG